MDILDILKEAKNPTKKVTITADDVDSEEPTDYSEDTADTELPNEDEGGTDYSEDDDTSDEDTEETTDEDAPAEDDTADDESTDDTTDDTPADETSDDDTDTQLPGEDDGGTDYSDDMDAPQGDGETSDEPNPDEQASNQPQEEPQAQDSNSLRNKTLKNDMIELYFNIKNNISKFDNIEYPDALSRKTLIEGRKQLNDLLEYLYNYIIISYGSKSYSENLFTYKYVVELYKMSITMIGKIRSFGANGQNK